MTRQFQINCDVIRALDDIAAHTSGRLWLKDPIKPGSDGWRYPHRHKDGDIRRKKWASGSRLAAAYLLGVIEYTGLGRLKAMGEETKTLYANVKVSLGPPFQHNCLKMSWEQGQKDVADLLSE